MKKDEEGQRELAKDAERVKRRTEELLRKESMKDPKVAGEEATHDEQMQQEKTSMTRSTRTMVRTKDRAEEESG